MVRYYGRPVFLEREPPVSVFRAARQSRFPKASIDLEGGPIAGRAFVRAKRRMTPLEPCFGE